MRESQDEKLLSMKESGLEKIHQSKTIMEDEFMRFCHMIGTEPYICLNVGSGTVEEAHSWVEHCNSDKNTILVQQRWGNGSPKPYDVQIWDIGNENWICGILVEKK